MNSAKPVVLFFSRDYQSGFFPLLKSKLYDSIHVTLTRSEKRTVERLGGIVVGCLEEDFYQLREENIDFPYLEYSWGSDRFLKGYTYQKRMTILQKIVRFWSEILDKYEPLKVVNETVAIETAEVLYIESKKRGIEYLSWMSFPKENTFYWQVNPSHNSLFPRLRDINPSEEHLREAEIFIARIKDGVEKPFYVKNLQPRTSINKLLKIAYSLFIEGMKRLKIRDRVIRQLCYGESIDFYFWNLKLFFLSIFSRKYDDLPDENGAQELIFYPLHYEPEAVLFYMAYFYDNQLTHIENILKCLAENQILIVKEHPQQQGVLLQKKYKKLKSRFPNLIFLPAEISTNQVIAVSKIVVTLGSTVGFETLALGKTVINMGRIFYDSFEAVNNCKCYHELYDLLRGRKAYNEKGDFKIFVAKMLAYVNKGNPFPHHNLYHVENLQAVTRSIENEIGAIN